LTVTEPRMLTIVIVKKHPLFILLQIYFLVRIYLRLRILVRAGNNREVLI